MKAPQIIYLALVAIGLGIDMERHGKPKEGNYSATTTFIASSIVIGLLYWGGFFS